LIKAIEFRSYLGRNVAQDCAIFQVLIQAKERSHRFQVKTVEQSLTGHSFTRDVRRQSCRRIGSTLPGGEGQAWLSLLGFLPMRGYVPVPAFMRVFAKQEKTPPLQRDTPLVFLLQAV
jgi:hypothetical protein